MAAINGYYFRYNPKTSRAEFLNYLPPRESEKWQPISLDSYPPEIRAEILGKYPPAPVRRSHAVEIDID